MRYRRVLVSVLVSGCGLLLVRGTAAGDKDKELPAVNVKVLKFAESKGAGKNNVVNFSFWELWCSSIPHESLRVLC
jgi:hypothetical protein